MFPELTIIENLFIGKKIPRNWIGNFDWKAMEKQADEIFNNLGVSFDFYMPLKLLSAANAKLVEIARALINEAKIIIMDEFINKHKEKFKSENLYFSSKLKK